MNNKSYDEWVAARTEEIKETWDTKKMLRKVRELGIQPDPTKKFSYPSLIARAEAQELRVDDYPPADVTGVPFRESLWTQQLDADFKPTARLLEEMRNHLEAHFGKTAVDQIAMSVTSPNTTYINTEFAEYDALLLADAIEQEPPEDDHETFGTGVEYGEHHIGLNVPVSDIHSASARDILQHVLPRVIDHFLLKNKDYGDAHRLSRYGVKGGMIDLDRKMGKLYDSIWLEKDMEWEDSETMLKEVIGGVFLMLDLMYRAGHPADDGVQE